MKLLLVLAIVAIAVVRGQENKVVQKNDVPSPIAPGTETERPCEGLECWNEGWCRDYTVCDKGTKSEGRCEDDLWWNPADLVTGHLTGQCDSWDNLNEDTQNKYTHDKDCIPPCAWWAKDEGGCSQNYFFREPFTTSVNGREHELSCSSGLVWSQDALNCVHCGNHQDANGNSCCGGGDGGADGGTGGTGGTGGDASGSR